ncbi:hypothetical protein SLA2020_269500 [Shorea laevis]
MNGFAIQIGLEALMIAGQRQGMAFSWALVWCLGQLKSKPTVACSSTKAEYCAMAIIAAELFWIRMLFKEMKIMLSAPPILWVNNLGARALASNPVFHARTKHIELDYHFIRETIVNQDISACSISTVDQLADIFTTGLTTSRFLLLRDNLMVRSLPVSLPGV